MPFKVDHNNRSFHKKTTIADVASEASMAGNSILFHPLCADRLTTEIGNNMDRLATTLQAACACVEKATSLLLKNSTAFNPSEISTLLEALYQSLEALQSIQLSTDKVGSSLVPQMKTIRTAMTLILNVTNKISSRAEINRLLAEIQNELNVDATSSKERETLLKQKDTLINILNEKN